MRASKNLSPAEDEQALLAEEPEDTQDHSITGTHVIAPETMWEAIQGLQKKVDLLAGTPQTHIIDASLKRKISQKAKAESKNDSTSQPGPSEKRARQALSDSDDATEDSDRDEVEAMLEEGQDGDSSDKLLKEIEEEYNNADKTGPNINEPLANLII